MTLQGKTVLVTAGPTRERIDPVRYLSNFSSGKMGYAIAARARARGAQVLLVTGPVALTPPEGVRVLPVESALDLLAVMQENAPKADIVIQAAAVADYRPAQAAPQKIKKAHGEELVLRLVENPDVAAAIGRNKRDDQVFVVFAAETQNLFENAAAKLLRKNADFIVANDVTKAGAGFGTDTNVASILTRSERRDYPMMAKEDLADVILDRALAILEGR